MSPSKIHLTYKYHMVQQTNISIESIYNQLIVPKKLNYVGLIKNVWDLVSLTRKKMNHKTRWRMKGI